MGAKTATWTDLGEAETIAGRRTRETGLDQTTTTRAARRDDYQGDICGVGSGKRQDTL